MGAGIASVETALARLAAVERLQGDNRYKCDGCKSYVAADRSTRLEAAPHMLQICLKRFALGRHAKITTRCSFPEQLDMRPYMAAGCLDKGPLRYRLYAVVVHIDVGRSTDYGEQLLALFLCAPKSMPAGLYCTCVWIAWPAATSLFLCCSLSLPLLRLALAICPPPPLQDTTLPMSAVVTAGSCVMTPVCPM